MADPYIGEIRIFGGNFAPVGWAFCLGQELPISENESLFNLIGTQYGGDGQSTFGLPNLGGRVPVMSDYGGANGWGATWQFGHFWGEESVTLSVAQMPVHDHMAFGTVNAGSAASAQGAVPASLPSQGTGSAYGTRPPTGTIFPGSIGTAGSNQPHDNMQPYCVVSYIIALVGIYPSPN